MSRFLSIHHEKNKFNSKSSFRVSLINIRRTWQDFIMCCSIYRNSIWPTYIHSCCPFKYYTNSEPEKKKVPETFNFSCSVGELTRFFIFLSFGNAQRTRPGQTFLAGQLRTFCVLQFPTNKQFCTILMFDFLVMYGAEDFCPFLLLSVLLCVCV